MKKLEIVPNLWLRLMRYAWIVTAVLAFGILVAALPHYYAKVLGEAANSLVDGPPDQPPAALPSEGAAALQIATAPGTSEPEPLAALHEGAVPAFFGIPPRPPKRKRH